MVVRAALTSSGAQSVASFGAVVGGSLDIGVVSDWGLDRPLRELEILEVPTAASIAPTTRYPVDAAVPFAGGPEGFGARPGTAPGLFTVGDDAAVRGGAPLLDHATPCNDVRPVLPRPPTSTARCSRPTRQYPCPRAVHDYWPAPLTEETPDLSDHQSVRVDDGTARATASSTLAEPALGQGRRARQRRLAGRRRQRRDGVAILGVRPAGPVGPDRLGNADGPASECGGDTRHRGRRERRRVLGHDGHRRERTPVTSAEFAGDVDPRGTRLRSRSHPERRRRSGSPSRPSATLGPTVRVLDIGAGTLPRVQPWVRLPLTDQTPSVVGLRASPDERSACYPMESGVLACSPDRARVGEESNGIRRELTLDQPRSFTVTGTVVAAGEGADALLRRLDGVRAAGSSRWLADAGVSAELTVDGDPRTYWAADPDDEEPRLTLSWPTPRLVEGLRFDLDPDAAGRRPTTVDVTVGGATVRRRTLSREGVISLPTRQAAGLSVGVVRPGHRAGEPHDVGGEGDAGRHRRRGPHR